MSSFYRIKLKKFRTRISVFYLTINWPLSILSKNNYELVYVLIHFLNMRYIHTIYQLFKECYLSSIFKVLAINMTVELDSRVFAGFFSRNYFLQNPHEL